MRQKVENRLLFANLLKGPLTVVMGVIMIAASDFEENKFLVKCFCFFIHAC